jgi:hypothetical protein
LRPRALSSTHYNFRRFVRLVIDRDDQALLRLGDWLFAASAT